MIGQVLSVCNKATEKLRTAEASSSTLILVPLQKLELKNAIT